MLIRDKHFDDGVRHCYDTPCRIGILWWRHCDIGEVGMLWTAYFDVTDGLDFLALSLSGDVIVVTDVVGMGHPLRLLRRCGLPRDNVRVGCVIAIHYLQNINTGITWRPTYVPQRSRIICPEGINCSTFSTLIHCISHGRFPEKIGENHSDI